MKIGIYGGSFNPPHLGHMTAAAAAIRQLGLDRLLLIPAGDPPHKELTEDTPEPEHRLAMARLAAEQIALETGVTVEVSDREIRRAGKSYTVDTLRDLHAEEPEAKLWLLMGTDMFLSFHTWRAPDEITRLAGLCAFGRAKQDTQELLAPQRARLEEAYPSCRIKTMVLPDVVEVSSTLLRSVLPQGGGADALSPAIFGYILREGLYGTHTELKNLSPDALRPIALSYLKAKRIPHVLGTEQEAVRLAERCGADVRKARIAALLHDCTKRLSLEEQLALCAQHGVALDELERVTLKLLHAKTGAAIARDVFGADKDVVEAICWHTTGKPDMTLLEKVIYLADYIEPNRRFDGVEELRRAVYEDIDKGLLMGLSMTVDEMREKGYAIHPDTLQARDFLRGNFNDKIKTG